MPSFKSRCHSERSEESAVPYAERKFARVILALCLALTGACATFANVRSATVDEGSSFEMQASSSGRPGPVAGWFWSFDCDGGCGSAAPLGLDLNYTHGWRPNSGARPVSLGAGIASVIPYVEGYAQLSESKSHPFGVGARVGTFGPQYVQGHVYGRMDASLANDVRLLWNPGLFYLATHSPNGMSRGTFLGITQGVGLQIGAGNVLLIPSAAAVWGHAKRSSYGYPLAESRLFGTVGLAIAFRHDPRRAAPR